MDYDLFVNVLVYTWVVCILWAIPSAIIFRRVGWSPWLALILLIPIPPLVPPLLIVSVYFLGMAKWPAKEDGRLSKPRGV